MIRDDRFRITRIPLADLTEDHLTQIYDRAKRTETAEHERALDNVVLNSIARERDAAEATVERVRALLTAPGNSRQILPGDLRAALDSGEVSG